MHKFCLTNPFLRNNCIKTVIFNSIFLTKFFFFTKLFFPILFFFLPKLPSTNSFLFTFLPTSIFSNPNCLEQKSVWKVFSPFFFYLSFFGPKPFWDKNFCFTKQFFNRAFFYQNFLGQIFWPNSSFFKFSSTIFFITVIFGQK